jgi:hypothetical protein
MSTANPKDSFAPGTPHNPTAAAREALRRELLKRIVANEAQRRDQRKGSDRT